MKEAFLNLWSYPYIRWHILFIFIPTIILWAGWGKYFLRYKKTILFIMIFSFIWGLLFDLTASPLLHVWYFDRVKTIGFWFLGIPLEEYAFLLLFPQMIAVLFLLFRKFLYAKHR